ncbi:MAG: hypothetical protein Q7I92_06200 [Humidesulfovibrio sp.]|jgi:hypothetical protein|nr:hypothetical protein [Humidesulfovibrio sp.]
MDISTLSTSMINQATTAVSTQVPLHAQQAPAENPGKSSSEDSVNISDVARAKAAAATPPAADGTQSTADSLARRIAKLQKQLQQEQGSDMSDQEKSGQLATLRSQILHLQSQQKASVGSIGGTEAAPLKMTQV